MNPDTQLLHDHILKNSSVPRISGFVQLVGIRDLFGDERNEGNDGLALIMGDSRIKLYRCTTDPGIPLPGRKVHPDGLAWLVPDCQYRFVHGRHKDRPALVQAEPFITFRTDPYEGLHRDSSIIPFKTFSNVVGLNIHRADPVDHDHVNGWSMGCIAIRSEDGWQNFLMNCAFGKLNGVKQQVFPMKMTFWDKLNWIRHLELPHEIEIELS